MLLTLEEVPKAVMQNSKESCEIDTIVIVAPKLGEITDEEEIEVEGDASVLSKDVSSTFEVAESSVVRNWKMNHKAEITETAAEIKMFNDTKIAEKRISFASHSHISKVLDTRG